MLGAYPSPIRLDGIGREASVVFSSVYRDDREFAAEGGHDQEGGQAQWPARAGMTSSA